MLLATCSVYAQISDNFTDGDLSQNPVWYGSILKLTVLIAYILMHHLKPLIHFYVLRVI